MTAASVTPGETFAAPRRSTSFEWRVRQAAVAMVLVALAFVQKPGKIVPDTKLDLVANPEGLLRRGVHLWDHLGAFGQLQNQGYGYLFPMGPFFWLGDVVGLPEWAVQRAWYALVLVVAFAGAVRLAEVLGVGSSLTQTVAGVAFAFSPRFLTTLGPISVEAWPSAVAPWVLVPLVWGATRGSPTRAAALSALAIACVGGVNAAAAAAVLPLPVLWLLSRSRGGRRTRMLLWWPLFTALGTFWWLVPLFLLGRYSPPFLDYIETARVTTFPTTVFDTLRGTAHWIPYIEPGWGAGRSLLSEPYLIIDTSVVLALGLMGLAHRWMPHRGFLVAGVMVGMLLVTAGHLGEVQGWIAEEVRRWLDGPLAPFRNVHKYDVVLRLPLILGLAHILAVGATARASTAGARHASGRSVQRVGIVLVAVVAVLGSAAPVLSGKLTSSGEFSGIPGYWSDTADWLAERDASTHALLVPGSSFGTYVWGRPGDEPMQALAHTPWAVRNAVPLAPPGNIRMLDAVETRLANGEGSAGLTQFLARAGVEYLVVRNDLVRSGDVPEAVLVHQALNDSPGIIRAADFGPDVGGGARLDDGDGPRVVANQGWQSVYPAVEIFRVSGAEAAVSSGAAPVVVGGPEDLLNLQDLDIVQQEPTVLAVDADPAVRPGRLILTDGLRKRATSFGRLHDNETQTLTAEDEREDESPAREYALGEGDRWTTVARFEGVAEVTASSSMSDVGGGAMAPQHNPFAAVDDDPETAWVSGFGDPRPWLELRFDRPVDPGRIEVRLDDAVGRDPRRLVVSSEQGRVASSPIEADDEGGVYLPDGLTDVLRIELARPSRTFGARLAIAEIRVPGLDVDRPLVLPEVPKRWGTPDTVVLTAAEGYRTGCVDVQGETRCAPGRSREGEDAGVLDRVVTLNARRNYPVQLWASPRPGDALDTLLQRDRFVSVSASSQTTLAPAGGPLAAVDGDAGTTWIADRDDTEPRLVVSWIGKRSVSELGLRLSGTVAAVPATKVELVSPDGRRTVRPGRDGRATFEELRTDRLEIRFVGWEGGNNLDYDGVAARLPVGVSEVDLPGVELLPLEMTENIRDWGCSSGPTLAVNGDTRRTALVGSARDLFRGEAVEARLCGGQTLELQEGENRVVAGEGAGVRADAVVFGVREAPTAAEVIPLDLRHVTPTHTVLDGVDDPDTRTIAMRENYNDGWRARLSSHTLVPLTIDGWQQGWEVVESGDVGTVDVTFAPGGVYRWSLLAGLCAGLLLLAIVLGLSRGTHLGGAARRRSDGRLPVLGTRPFNRRAAALLAVGATGLVSGTQGALLVVLVLALGSWGAVRTRLNLAPGMLTVPVAGAAAAYVLTPWGDPEGWAGAGSFAQLCATLALSLVLAVALLDPDRLPRRMKGRSTPQ